MSSTFTPGINAPVINITDAGTGTGLTNQNNGPPTLTLPSNLLYPLSNSSSPGIQSSAVNLSFSTTGSGPMTFSCTYETIGLSTSDPNYATPGANTNCSTLATLSTSAAGVLYKTTNVWTATSSSSSATGTIAWIPTSTQRGTFKFNISVTDSLNQTTSGSTYVTIRENYTTSNLLALLDATASDAGLGSSLTNIPVQPRISSNSNNTITNPFSSLMGFAYGSLSGFSTSSPYQGTGEASTSNVLPYSLSFNGSNDSMNIQSALGSSSTVALETWVKTPNPTTTGAMIVSNSTGTATPNGFQLRQSTNPPSHAEFAIGNKYYSYRDLILSDHPVGYWRLGETSGTTAYDLTGYGNNGLYQGTVNTDYVLNNSGSLTGSGDTDPSVNFTGTSGYMKITYGNQYNLGTGDFSMTLWFKKTASSGVRGDLINWKYANNQDFGLFMNGTTFQFYHYNGSSTTSLTSGATPVSEGAWHYAVLTRQSGTASIYIDGSLLAQGADTMSFSSWSSSSIPIYIGANHAFNNYSSISAAFNGSIDEFELYNYALSAQQINQHYLAATTTQAIPYPGNAILADKPIGYWRLNETSGKVAYDYSGYSNHGTYSNTGYQQGVTGPLTNDSATATYFGGTSGNVIIPTTLVIPIGTPVTLEFWNYPTGPRTQQTISFGAADDGLNRFQTHAPYADSYMYWDYGNASSGTGRVSTAYSASYLNTWTHNILVSSGSQNVLKKIYINNTQVASATSSGNPSYNLIGGSIGSAPASTTFYQGQLFDVAVYNYILSPTQIANHYNSGYGAGWWYCQSRRLLDSTSWNLLTALYDGTTSQLFVNGQKECSITSSTSYSNATDNTYVGASSSSAHFWSGIMSYLGLYGSNSTPLTSIQIQKDFSATANRFRQKPVEDIVASNLILHLDAANAQQGASPYSNGCPNSNLSWFDLSPSATNPTLFSFSSCGSTSGWYNSGSASGPFTLSTNGSSNYVQVTLSSTLTNYTFEAWAKITSAVANAAVISTSGNTNSYLNIGSGLLPWQFNSASSTTAATTGVWSHIVGTQNGSSQTLFVNGTQAGTGTASSSVSAVDIGRRGDGVYFNGSISIVRIYSRALSQTEIQQNCIAQAARFSVSTCAGP